jgi:hypothetical protein
LQYHWYYVSMTMVQNRAQLSFWML